MKDFRADLHCHSLCSDGTVSPEGLVQLAIKVGLSGFSITDHDSIEAYPAAMLEAKKLGLEMISGVEFSSVHKGVSVHILCYSFSLGDSFIHQLCHTHKIRRHNRNREILRKLNAQGMFITEEDISQSVYDLPEGRRTIGRPHIAQAMMRKGYVKTVSEAFKKYLGDGESCFAPGNPSASKRP